ncbi:putative ubiquitin conjugating enzyme [Metarhizium anisopliae]
MQFHVKRTLEGGHDIRGYELPSWALLVFLVDILALIPVFLLFQYTFKLVYPVFAMVEDENPPAYEPVPLDQPASGGEEGVARNSFKPTNGRPRTVTSSFRAINRLLMANGGVAANFRGFFCYLAQVLLTTLLMGIFTGTFGGYLFPVATLLASLALVQYSTAWVHIVISEPSPLPFWSRLPPFRRTFEATWQAVTIFWFASEVTRFIPVVMALVLGITMPQGGFNEPLDMDALGPGFFAKSLVVTVVTVAASVFVIIPAYVVLVRVQASLLPVEQSTIIPFDRSFEGKVEPEVVGGKGYATVSDAWTTFSKTSWRRLLILYVKMFCLSLAAMALLVAVLVPQTIFIAKHSKEVR